MPSSPGPVVSSSDSKSSGRWCAQAEITSWYSPVDMYSQSSLLLLFSRTSMYSISSSTVSIGSSTQASSGSSSSSTILGASASVSIGTMGDTRLSSSAVRCAGGGALSPPKTREQTDGIRSSTTSAPRNPLLVARKSPSVVPWIAVYEEDLSL